MTINARQYGATIERVTGVAQQGRGCIMLDVAGPIVTEADIRQYGMEPYFSPTLPYVKGVVGEHTAHVTLRYGLLESGKDWKEVVDAVLADWVVPLSLQVNEISTFPSNADGEDYTVLIGKIEVTDHLLEGYARLGFLPHIDTFSEYSPHVTLAYVKGKQEDVIATPEFADAKIFLLSETELNVTGLNYGS
jgi:2'-5' RNA ligase